VGAVETPPALLGHVEQLEGHQQSLTSRAGTAGGSLPQPHGGEGRFDRIGGVQVLPMLGREVEERSEPLPVGGQRFHGLGVFGANPFGLNSQRQGA
jgi:hypothetical protein